MSPPTLLLFFTTTAVVFVCFPSLSLSQKIKFKFFLLCLQKLPERQFCLQLKVCTIHWSRNTETWFYYTVFVSPLIKYYINTQIMMSQPHDIKSRCMQISHVFTVKQAIWTLFMAIWAAGNTSCLLYYFSLFYLVLSYLQWHWDVKLSPKNKSKVDVTDVAAPLFHTSTFCSFNTTETRHRDPVCSKMILYEPLLFRSGCAAGATVFFWSAHVVEMREIIAFRAECWLGLLCTSSRYHIHHAVNQHCSLVVWCSMSVQLSGI